MRIKCLLSLFCLWVWLSSLVSAMSPAWLNERENAVLWQKQTATSDSWWRREKQSPHRLRSRGNPYVVCILFKRLQMKTFFLGLVKTSSSYVLAIVCSVYVWERWDKHLYTLDSINDRFGFIDVTWMLGLSRVRPGCLGLLSINVCAIAMAGLDSL